MPVAFASFLAGADILLICEEQKNLLESISLIREKVIREDALLERLDESNKRVMEAKSRFLKKKINISLEEVKSYFGSLLA